MTVCPAKAISRGDDGIVHIDHDRCIGCGMCARYCPIDMILMDPQKKKAHKCEMCQGQPVCVEACPTGALELVQVVKTSSSPDDRFNPESGRQIND
ncbi:MAG: 4Fe-4S binding protein [Desulfobacterales bacterium]|nr:4Fe-4S binding protein [Desulfobacterales bacterium]